MFIKNDSLENAFKIELQRKAELEQLRHPDNQSDKSMTIHEKLTNLLSELENGELDDYINAKLQILNKYSELIPDALQETPFETFKHKSGKVMAYGGYRIFQDSIEYHMSTIINIENFKKVEDYDIHLKIFQEIEKTLKLNHFKKFFVSF